MQACASHIHTLYILLLVEPWKEMINRKYFLVYLSIAVSYITCYAYFNMKEELVPEEIREQSVLISGDSAQVIRELIL